MSATYDETSAASVTLPAAPAGKEWFLLNPDGTTAITSSLAVSLRRAEGVVFVTGTRILHVSALGSDTTGTGTATLPYLTFAKAQTVANANDVIQGRGGDTFRATNTISVNGLTFGSYGTGQAIFSGADVMTGWAVNAVGVNTWSVALTTQPLMVFAGASRATQGSSASTLTDLQWFWASNTLYFRNNAGNPDSVGPAIEASQRNYCFDSNSKTGLKLNNVVVQRSQHTSNGAIYFNGAGTLDGISVVNSTIQDNYTTGIYIHHDSALGTFTGNTIVGNGQHGIWHAASGTAGSTNQTITTNTVANNGWRLDGGVNFPSGIIGSIRSGVVAFNTVTANGATGSGDHAHGIYLSSDLAPGLSLLVHDNTCSGHTQGHGIKCTQDATIYNNTIHDNLGGGMNLGQNSGSNNVTIVAHHNLIYQNATTAAAGIDVSKSAGSGTLSFSGYNNTLYHNSTGSSAGELFVESNLAAFNWKNNIVYGSSTSGSKYVNVAVAQTGTISIDNNDYFNGDASTPFRYNGTSVSLATWKAEAFTPDAHAVTSDPLFIVSGTPAFSLQATSPCINAGTPVTGITTGFLGLAPDMGFLEKA